ncbi:Acylphosphatase [Hibiscus syriacus]|uniref:Acylphosphatase n=1 Tax=Hibiscus syriacus TaxID=106335 RepID=A0A6A3BKU9_HIBSY|nr:Acylphosphatase [Hibiscus syriacus]
MVPICNWIPLSLILALLLRFALAFLFLLSSLSVFILFDPFSLQRPLLKLPVTPLSLPNPKRLKGWVRNRNRNDGSVEALFSGNPDSVQEMEQWCRRGPPAAMVTGLEVFPSSDDPGTGFERKQTV